MASTINISKIGLAVVVKPPSARTVVSKLSMAVVVGPETSKIQISKISMAVVVAPVDDATYAEVTQLPLLVIDKPESDTELTQLPVLLINLPFQDSQVTQLPLLTIFTSKPTPSPLPMIPESPVTEVWRWETALNISENGKEQRASLRAKPRVQLEFQVILLNDTDHRIIYQTLFENSDKIFNHPLYQYSAKLTAGASSPDTKVYFNPARTDIRPGEAIALFDPHENGTEIYATVDTVDADGATVTDALGVDIPEYYMVAPAPKFYFNGVPAISMESISGSVAMKVMSEAGRVQLRPSQSVSLTTLDGIPVLTKRPLANDQVEEAFNRNVTVLDNATAPAVLRTNWTTPFISGERIFLAQRPADMDYWRKFSDTVRGRRTPFLFPSWRDDLPLSSTPTLGATVITTTNTYYAKYFAGFSARYIMIRSRAGTIYRRVQDILIHYDNNGTPSSVDLILASSIGAGAGANENMVVSLMNLCRLDTDEIVLEHYELDTLVRFSVRTVDA